MARLYFIFVLISATQTVAQFYNEEPLRNSRQAGRRNGIQQGVRYGWQNPIRVAPTQSPLSWRRPTQQSSWSSPWNPNVLPKHPALPGQRQNAQSSWSRPTVLPKLPVLPPLQGMRPNEPYGSGPYWSPNALPKLPPPPLPYFPARTTHPTTTVRYFSQLSPTPSPNNPKYPSIVPPKSDYNPQQQRPKLTTRKPKPTKIPNQNEDEVSDTSETTDFERLPDSEAQTEQRSSCPSGSRKGRRNGKCYALGSTEPCHENMAFYADPSSKEFGHCDCIQSLNRPLVYHRDSDKCYFIFQQAYCQPKEWLVLDPERGVPHCDVNRCIDWTQSRSNWNWTSNGPHLENSGTVALLRERSCARLGWPCKQAGKGELRPLLEEDSTRAQPWPPLIRLTFSGLNLICEKDDEKSELQTVSDNQLEIGCKPGLINKWRIEGHCN